MHNAMKQPIFMYSKLDSLDVTLRKNPGTELADSSSNPRTKIVMDCVSDVEPGWAYTRWTCDSMSH